jgi:hypothetical protein
MQNLQCISKRFTELHAPKIKIVVTKMMSTGGNVIRTSIAELDATAGSP